MCETCSNNIHIKFETRTLKSSFYDYCNAYTLVKESKSVADADANNEDKQLIFKNCAPFTDCRSEMNNTRIDNAKNIDLVISMFNLIEYCDNYFKSSLWQYYRDK